MTPCLYGITDAKAYPNHTVTLTWSDGTRGVVDFTPYLGRRSLGHPCNLDSGVPCRNDGIAESSF